MSKDLHVGFLSTFKRLPPDGKESSPTDASTHLVDRATPVQIHGDHLDGKEGQGWEQSYSRLQDLSGTLPNRRLEELNDAWTYSIHIQKVANHSAFSSLMESFGADFVGLHIGKPETGQYLYADFRCETAAVSAIAKLQQGGVHCRISKERRPLCSRSSSFGNYSSSTTVWVKVKTRAAVERLIETCSPASLYSADVPFPFACYCFLHFLSAEAALVSTSCWQKQLRKLGLERFKIHDAPTGFADFTTAQVRKAICAAFGKDRASTKKTPGRPVKEQLDKQETRLQSPATKEAVSHCTSAKDRVRMTDGTTSKQGRDRQTSTGKTILGDSKALSNYLLHQQRDVLQSLCVKFGCSVEGSAITGTPESLSELTRELSATFGQHVENLSENEWIFLTKRPVYYSGLSVLEKAFRPYKEQCGGEVVMETDRKNRKLVFVGRKKIMEKCWKWIMAFPADAYCMGRIPVEDKDSCLCHLDNVYQEFNVTVSVSPINDDFIELLFAGDEADVIAAHNWLGRELAYFDESDGDFPETVKGENENAGGFGKQPLPVSPSASNASKATKHKGGQSLRQDAQPQHHAKSSGQRQVREREEVRLTRSYSVADLSQSLNGIPVNVRASYSDLSQLAANPSSSQKRKQGSAGAVCVSKEQTRSRQRVLYPAKVASTHEAELSANGVTLEGESLGREQMQACKTAEQLSVPPLPRMPIAKSRLRPEPALASRKESQAQEKQSLLIDQVHPERNTAFDRKDAVLQADSYKRKVVASVQGGVSCEDEWRTSLPSDCPRRKISGGHAPQTSQSRLSNSEHDSQSGRSTETVRQSTPAIASEVTSHLMLDKAIWQALKEHSTEGCQWLDVFSSPWALSLNIKMEQDETHYWLAFTGEPGKILDCHDHIMSSYTVDKSLWGAVQWQKPKLLDDITEKFTVNVSPLESENHDHIKLRFDGDALAVLWARKVLHEHVLNHKLVMTTPKSSAEESRTEVSTGKQSKRQCEERSASEQERSRDPDTIKVPFLPRAHLSSAKRCLTFHSLRTAVDLSMIESGNTDGCIVVTGAREKRRKAADCLKQSLSSQTISVASKHFNPKSYKLSAVTPEQLYQRYGVACVKSEIDGHFSWTISGFAKEDIAVAVSRLKAFLKPCEKRLASFTTSLPGSGNNVMSEASAQAPLRSTNATYHPSSVNDSDTSASSAGDYYDSESDSDKSTSSSVHSCCFVEEALTDLPDEQRLLLVSSLAQSQEEPRRVLLANLEERFDVRLVVKTESQRLVVQGDKSQRVRNAAEELKHLPLGADLLKESVHLRAHRDLVQNVISEYQGRKDVVIQCTAEESPSCRLCTKYDRLHSFTENMWTGHTVLHNDRNTSPWHLRVTVYGIATQVKAVTEIFKSLKPWTASWPVSKATILKQVNEEADRVQRSHSVVIETNKLSGVVVAGLDQSTVASAMEDLHVLCD